jgi:hypothetical protein
VKSVVDLLFSIACRAPRQAFGSDCNTEAVLLYCGGKMRAADRSRSLRKEQGKESRMERLRAVRLWCEQHAAGLLFLVSLALVGAITLRGIDLKMDRIVPYRAPHHMYPIAISMLYHHGSPYAMYGEIQDGMKPMKCYLPYDEIFSPSIDDSTAFNNALLERMISTPIEKPGDTRLVAADDKGLVDIMILAFLLFGANVQGLFYTTILLLLCTVAVFFPGISPSRRDVLGARFYSGCVVCDHARLVAHA